LKINAPPADREAAGIPYEGSKDSYIGHLNPKHETNSNNINTNDKNQKLLRCLPLQNSLIGYYYQALYSCFHRLEHLNIRIYILFRNSKFEFRFFYGFPDFSPE